MGDWKKKMCERAFQSKLRRSEVLEMGSRRPPGVNEGEALFKESFKLGEKL